MNHTGLPYRFLPFRFDRKGTKVLLINDVGEYHFLDEQTFDLLVSRNLNINSQDFIDLVSKGMVYSDNLVNEIDLLATKYRTKKQFLYHFTSLHMFVLTKRCNHQCIYCHASSVDENAGSHLDMDFETARKCVEIAFTSPSPCIKIEFQGGEPLLNFNIVKEIVEYAEELNESANKGLEFVICTNLLALNEENLHYIESKNIYISTSLDGPHDIHDACRRLRRGGSSYDIVTSHLSWAINTLGRDRVSALMTVTPYNVGRLCEVVDEYLKQGLDSIFLRKMNPFGSALKNLAALDYSVDTFLTGYKEALDYIIQINLGGTHFPELFATLLLTRILTPFSTGFVDLQSPAGVGISGVIYETNGDVFVSDEARMLSRTTGDKKFCLGNVHTHSWNEMFGGSRLREIIAASCVESLPGCAWCVFQPYCGGDPVRNYATQGDMIGNRPNNDFCRKHRGLFNLMFDYLDRGDDNVEDVFWSWITCRSLDEVHNHSPIEVPQCYHSEVV